MSHKVILVGDTAVGKTSLITRFMEDPFSDRTISTMSPVFVKTTVDVNGESVPIEIWDTAGQEAYRSLMTVYYRGAEVAMLCFTKETADRNQEWVDTVRQVEPSCAIVLILTKDDLLESEERDELLNDLGGKKKQWQAGDVVVTSAKSGQGVREAFTSAAACVVGNELMGQAISLSDQHAAKKESGCC